MVLVRCLILLLRLALLILDVHTAATGNVGKAFVPSDGDTNLGVFETMCARLPYEMRTHEGFTCAR